MSRGPIPAALMDEWTYVRDLGSGGQGKVCEVRNANGLRCALKIPKLGDAVAVARFKREVESLLKVDHPAIVKVLDHSFDPEPYLLMPLGIQLEKYWVDLRATKPEELFARSQSLVLTLLSGLEAVHPLGIIHRDLKPGNVVVIDTSPS